MLIQDVCVDCVSVFELSFGDANSRRNLFGPGFRCMRALKVESVTGQVVAGNESW